MLNMVVKIQSVDMNGFVGRNYHPTPELVGRFVRITNMDTVPNEEEEHGGDGPGYQVFHGILLNPDGTEQEDALVQLVDFEIESVNGVPVLYSSLTR